MPKLILWEELWKEELVLLVKLLPEEQLLKGYKESSGSAAMMCSFCIMQLYNTLKDPFHLLNILFVTTGKSIMFGIKEKENWNFLKKYGAAT